MKEKRKQLKELCESAKFHAPRRVTVDSLEDQIGFTIALEGSISDDAGDLFVRLVDAKVPQDFPKKLRSLLRKDGCVQRDLLDDIEEEWDFAIQDAFLATEEGNDLLVKAEQASELFQDIVEEEDLDRLDLAEEVGCPWLGVWESYDRRASSSAPKPSSGAPLIEEHAEEFYPIFVDILDMEKALSDGEAIDIPSMGLKFQVRWHIASNDVCPDIEGVSPSESLDRATAQKVQAMLETMDVNALDTFGPGIADMPYPRAFSAAESRVNKQFQAVEKRIKRFVEKHDLAPSVIGEIVRHLEKVHKTGRLDLWHPWA